MTGLRESKKAATRAAIAEASLSVIAQSGISGLTISAIAEEAGVSVRTFHNYFSSATDAVQFVCSDILDRFADSLSEAPLEDDTFTCFENSINFIMRTIVSKGWESGNPFEIIMLLVSNGEIAVANEFFEKVRRVRAIIAQRESERDGTEYEADSVHICLLFQVAISAAKATADSFGFSHATSILDHGITEDDFSERLHSVFDELRRAFSQLHEPTTKTT